MKAKISKVAEDIIKIKFTDDMTLAQIEKVFDDLMVKHNINQYTPTKGGGKIGNNFEWTMCHSLFLNCLENHLMLNSFFK